MPENALRLIEESGAGAAMLGDRSAGDDSRKCKILRDIHAGSAAEFALVLPLLLLFMFGIVQYGTMFYAYGNMNNAAREAARALAVGDVNEAQAETLADSHLVGWLEGAEIEAENATTTGTDFVRVTINVSGAQAGMVPYAPVPTTLSARVLMREEE